MKKNVTNYYCQLIQSGGIPRRYEDYFFSLYNSELFDLLNKVSFISDHKRKPVLLQSRLVLLMICQANGLLTCSRQTCAWLHRGQHRDLWYPRISTSLLPQLHPVQPLVLCDFPLAKFTGKGDYIQSHTIKKSTVRMSVSQKQEIFTCSHVAVSLPLWKVIFNFPLWKQSSKLLTKSPSTVDDFFLI